MREGRWRAHKTEQTKGLFDGASVVPPGADGFDSLNRSVRLRLVRGAKPGIERRAEMFLYERQRTIINLDAVKDIFPGREPGSLAVSFMSGITSKISVYSSEIEVKKAIEMIAEQMATGKTTVIRVPTAEEVRTRLKNTRLLTEHHATGKKTKGHGGS